MCFARRKAWPNAKTSKSPIPPNNLKFTYISVLKLKATYRLRLPINKKNPAQLRFNLFHMGSAIFIFEPIIALIRFFLNIRFDRTSATAKAQYSAVGFHLMNVSSFRASVAPPKITMIPKLIIIIFSSFLCFNHDQPAWPMVATIAAAVAAMMP